MSFQTARQNLSIIQVAEHLGYAYNKAKGQIKPQYEHPNGDKIIVTNPHENSVQMYFNRDGTENGSVIDFIKNRLHQFSGIAYQKDMDGVNQVLRQFKAIDPIPMGQNASYNPSSLPKLIEKKPFNNKDFQIRAFDATHYSYFISRAISVQTLDKFSKHIAIVKDNAHSHYNIGFPYKNEKNEVVGYELRNQNFKGHARNSNKESGVWMANFAAENGLTRQVFLFESAIDAMSFYQLFKDKFDFDNAAFISFGGGVSHKQIDTVLNTFPQAKYYSGFDNDVNGHVYDFVVEKKLNPKLVMDMKRVGEEFVIKHKETEIKMPMAEFSLEKLSKLTGAEMMLYVAKPKDISMKDFNEALQKKENRVNEKRTMKY
jgi:Toprim-like/Protein of unknown function (DUF3991)